MSSILQQKVVLVLNKAWQAINIRTPEEVFPQLATGAATALDIDCQQKIRPVTWEEWITLPVREQDRAVQTIRGGIRVPTVIVLANYAKVPRNARSCAPRASVSGTATAANTPEECCVQRRVPSTTSCLVHGAARTPGKTWCGPPRTSTPRRPTGCRRRQASSS